MAPAPAAARCAAGSRVVCRVAYPLPAFGTEVIRVAAVYRGAAFPAAVFRIAVVVAPREVALPAVAHMSVRAAVVAAVPTTDHSLRRLFTGFATAARIV